MGLLAVVFALVPGYIADLVFRACWGMAKGDEFDRTLRAIIWSILGLIIYATVLGGPPNFITAVLPGASPPAFDWRIGLAFGIDVVFSSVAAFAVGRLTTRKRWKNTFTRLFRRSPTSELPWDLLWTDLADGRGVKVLTRAGETYLGHVKSASHRSDDRELVLRDPVDVTSGIPKPLAMTRYMYLSKDEIAQVHLSYNEKEMENAKRTDPGESTKRARRDPAIREEHSGGEHRLANSGDSESSPELRSGESVGPRSKPGE